MLLRYPAILVMRCLPLRYCSTRFASRVSSWRLPLWGNVADLATEGGEGSELFVLLHALMLMLLRILGLEELEVTGGPGGLRKRVRLSKTTRAHLV